MMNPVFLVYIYNNFLTTALNLTFDCQIDKELKSVIENTFFVLFLLS